jgi:uncharacterized protein YbjT (DUF2867 family)
VNANVLVIGAAGKFAGLVVPELVRRRARVRAFVRDEAAAERARARGAAECVFGDLRDVRSLAHAMRGIDGVFHIGPAFVHDEAQLGLNVVAAARDAGVRKFVFSSVIQPTNTDLANHASKIPVEAALFRSDMEYTILHPANLMQNVAGAWRKALQEGVFGEPFPVETLIARVDYRDVAEVAARALTEDTFRFGSYELASEMIDRREIARLMTELAGRPIVAEEMSFDAWVARYAPPYNVGQLPLLAKVFEHYAAHGLGGNDLTLRALLGRPPTTMREYLRDLASAAVP